MEQRFYMYFPKYKQNVCLQKDTSNVCLQKYTCNVCLQKYTCNVCLRKDTGNVCHPKDAGNVGKILNLICSSTLIGFPSRVTWCPVRLH